MSSDQPTKGRRKGARGRKPKQQSDLQDHDVADEPSTEIAAAVVSDDRPAAPRENSPNNDGGSMVSTASSAALQQLKERSKDEFVRRQAAFIRLEEEKESSQRADISDHERSERDRLMSDHRHFAGVMSVIAAQRQSTHNVLLKRQHMQQLLVIEDEENEGRDELLDDEIESLGIIVAAQCVASVDMITSSTAVLVEGDDVPSTSSSPTPSASAIPACAPKREASLVEATEDLDEFCKNAPPPPPRTTFSSPQPRALESSCPCSVM